ncbi:putative endonuclease 8 2 [Planobispora rosea]|uniref:DNA-(apurinic or apyrimidinic site) lyase n=1 Tax=Planobispora rosea TaxID=35762 RepID=A0A8J3S276_PLARO|nr:DNA-formamidopyrimidine glycosylase family protein [Planobispora rosea]GGS46783.1 putative endonuclease 8 2 [Planobispora rosea]GIH82303.1 putative endonuclease 8 2 [Planobispora rosea]
MPEGDVVHRTAERLGRALDGRPLTRSDFRVPRHATADLTGRIVLETVPRGKHLLTRVEGGLTVHTHLRMEGAWHISPAGRRVPQGDLVRLVLANAEWQAVGVRLGMVDLLRTGEEHRVVGHLGPDPLGPDWDAREVVRRLLEDPGRTIGEALLDQRNLAGIGTIYRAETLFLAGIWPWRPVEAVADAGDGVSTDADTGAGGDADAGRGDGTGGRSARRPAGGGRGAGGLVGLVELARELLEANKDRPENRTTTGDLRPGRGMWVYGRAGRACLRCGGRISRGEMGARTQERLIYWCPRCQSI